MISCLHRQSSDGRREGVQEPSGPAQPRGGDAHDGEAQGPFWSIQANVDAVPSILAADSTIWPMWKKNLKPDKVLPDLGNFWKIMVTKRSAAPCYLHHICRNCGLCAAIKLGIVGIVPGTTPTPRQFHSHVWAETRAGRSMQKRSVGWGHQVQGLYFSTGLGIFSPCSF